MKMKKTIISTILILSANLLLSAVPLANDLIEDAWEALYSPAYINPALYDAHEDNDDDGWSNWAEARYSSAYSDSAPDNSAQFPVPSIAVTFRYSGQQTAADIVILSYNSKDMSTPPDVKYIAACTNNWPQTAVLQYPSSGRIREGLNYFFAFLDVNGSGTWNNGEPCGIPDQYITPNWYYLNYAVDIGWDSSKMDIELTDSQPGYLRLELNPGVKSISVYRSSGSNPHTVLERTVSQSRPYLCEADFMSFGEMALDWDTLAADDPAVTSSVYVVYADNTVVATITNVFDNVQAVAEIIKPSHGGYVYSSRPRFKWTMQPGYPAFAVQIRKTNATGPVVYASQPLMAPSRDVATGIYQWSAPIHAGSILPSGQLFNAAQTYAWRVIALNSKYSSTSSTRWSDWKYFYLATETNNAAAVHGYGTIEVSVKYYGTVTDQSLVKVQAYTSRDFTGVPSSKHILTGTELTDLTAAGTTNSNALLTGLLPSAFAGDYYIMAYVDCNNNEIRDIWEPWGYANHVGTNILVNSEVPVAYRSLYGHLTAPYEARPVTVATGINPPTATIIIQDADTDQDRWTDGWEYQMNPGENFLAPIGPEYDSIGFPEDFY